MLWLVCDERRVAPLALATLPWEKGRGLLGLSSFDGALLISPVSFIHTIGMRFPIDVAYCDERLRVLAVTTMPRHWLGRPRLHTRSVLEAAAGAFAGWGLRKGSHLDIEDGARR